MNVDSLYAPVTIADTSVIGQHCVLGYPKEARLRQSQHDPVSTTRGAPVAIGERCLVFNHVILHEGVQIGDDCVIEDRVRIGYDSTIGDRARLAYGAYVCDRVIIGADACVAGFVCDGTAIGDGATVMGDLVHEYTRPHQGWWGIDEAPPVIEAESVVGYGARVVGGVQIGPRSYVASGSIVTKDVPPNHVVVGVNRHTPVQHWPGDRLQSLIRHWQTQPAAHETRTPRGA